MSTKSTVITLLRAILGDTLQTGRDIFQYTTSNVFVLTESNAQTISSVSVNDVSSGVTYTYDSTYKKLTISSSLLTGDIVEVEYDYYSNFSDTELEGYIKHALSYISINKYADWSFDDRLL